MQIPKFHFTFSLGISTSLSRTVLSKMEEKKSHEMNILNSATLDTGTKSC